MLETHKFNFKP